MVRFQIAYGQNPRPYINTESIIRLVNLDGIFYIRQELLNLNKEMVQSFIFLKLAVAAHLTIFLTRTRGPFWSIKPGAILLWSAIVTKILATLLVVYCWYVSPIGWKLALLVWGYALAAFVITDLVKVRFYKLLDHSDLRFSKP